ncbi:hypothetical protein [Nonomuraea dietziae]|uniref:hypothetical protein n=1 Tax=Nonomuraea dietziae TaxID=65515 RepID=UPI0031E3B55F
MSITRAASPGRAETWIFQPCSGSPASTGRRATSSPCSVRAQPVGAGLLAWTKSAAPSITGES